MKALTRGVGLGVLVFLLVGWRLPFGVLAVANGPLRGVVRDHVEVGGQPFKLVSAPTVDRLVAINALGYASCIDTTTRVEGARSPQLLNGDNAFEAVALLDERTVAVWSYYSSKLHFVDSISCRDTGWIEVGANLGKAAPVPGATLLVVASVGDARLHLVDTDSRQILSSLQLEAPIGHVLVSGDGSTLFATGGVYLGSSPTGSRLLRVEAAGGSLRLSRDVDLPPDAHPLGLALTEAALQVTDRAGARLLLFSTDTLERLGALDVGFAPEDILRPRPLAKGVAPTVVLSQQSSTLSVVAPAGSRRIIADTVPISGHPCQLAMAPRSAILAVSLPGRALKTPRASGQDIVHGAPREPGQVMDAVSLVSLSQWYETDVIFPCEGPRALAWAADEQFLAVACANDGTVAFIE